MEADEVREAARRHVVLGLWTTARALTFPVREMASIAEL